MPSVEERLAKLEKEMEELKRAQWMRISSTTDEPPAEVTDEILELIYSNQKLEAVKSYKKLSGASLMDAKRFIEQLTRKLRQQSPEKFEEKFEAKSRPGCARLVLLALSLSCALAGVFLLFKIY